MRKLLHSAVMLIFAILAIYNLCIGIYYLSNLVLLYGAERALQGVLLSACMYMWAKRWYYD